MTDTETKLDDAWNEHVERSGGPLTLDHYDGFVAGWNAAHATARVQPASVVTDEMVTRFLGWRLPDTFAPDCYISFDREGIKKMGNGSHWPVGTNLFTDPETRAMLEHVLVAAPQPLAKGGWRPIETAPCDGRFALVYRPLADMSGDKCIAIKRLVGGNNFCWPQTVPDGSTPTNPTADGACHVTHWMPLPEPPENEDE